MKNPLLAQYLAIQVREIGDKVEASKLSANDPIQLHVDRALSELAAAVVYAMRPVKAPVVRDDYEQERDGTVLCAVVESYL